MTITGCNKGLFHYFAVLASRHPQSGENFPFSNDQEHIERIVEDCKTFKDEHGVALVSMLTEVRAKDGNQIILLSPSSNDGSSKKRSDLFGSLEALIHGLSKVRIAITTFSEEGDFKNDE